MTNVLENGLQVVKKNVKKGLIAFSLMHALQSCVPPIQNDTNHPTQEQIADRNKELLLEEKNRANQYEIQLLNNCFVKFTDSNWKEKKIANGGLYEGIRIDLINTNNGLNYRLQKESGGEIIYELLLSDEGKVVNSYHLTRDDVNKVLADYPQGFDIK